MPRAPAPVPPGVVQPGRYVSPAPPVGPPLPVHPPTPAPLSGGRRSNGLGVVIGALSVAILAALVGIVVVLVTRSDSSGGDDAASSSQANGQGPTTSVLSGADQGAPTGGSQATPTSVAPPPILVRAERYLEQSAQGLAAVQAGVDACRRGDATAAIVGLQDGKTNREEILAGLSGQNIAGFENLFEDMQQAMVRSIEADVLYQQWVESTGCLPGVESGYLNLADLKSQEAAEAKRRFVAGWNPVARQYGLGEFRADQI